MRQATLDTRQIVDIIKDNFDDLRMVGAIPDIIYQRKTTPARILEAINSADIDTCGHLSLEITAIAFLPGGIFEFSTNVQDKYEYEMIQALANNEHVDPYSLSNLINKRRWTNYGDLRSSYFYAYSQAPLGNAQPIKRYRIVSESIFNNPHLRDDLCWDEGFIYIEPATGRCRLSEVTPSDTFFTWTATMLPAKLNIPGTRESYGDDSLFEQYDIATPVWAKDLLIAKAMLSLVPVTSDVRNRYLGVYNESLAAALRNMPVQTSTFQTQYYIGPE